MKKLCFKNISWFLAFFSILTIFAWLKIVPSGQKIYLHDFSKNFYRLTGPDKFIGQITPEDRIEKTDEGLIKIIGEPVYFNLFLPRHFSGAKIKIKYKNDLEEKDYPLFEIGFLANKQLGHYQLKSLENKIVEKIMPFWGKEAIESGYFLQKNSDFLSFSDFLENLPPIAEIATYNYDFNYPVKLDNYQAEKEQTEYLVGVENSFEFYTYLKQEDFNFIFDFEQKEEDKNEMIYLRLSCFNQLVQEKSFSGSGQLNWLIENLPAGVYKIEVKADNFITKKIKTSQTKLAFGPQLSLASLDRSDFSLFTDSQKIQVKIIDPINSQTLKIVDQPWPITETYQQFDFQRSDFSLAKINLEKDGLILTGSSFFFFEPNHFFQPRVRKISTGAILQDKNFKYALINYQPNQLQTDGWHLAEADFDLGLAYQENNNYTVVLSIPNLKVEDKNQGVLIKSIQIEVKGKNLLEKIRGYWPF